MASAIEAEFGTPITKGLIARETVSEQAMDIIATLQDIAVTDYGSFTMAQGCDAYGATTIIILGNFVSHHAVVIKPAHCGN